MAKKEIGTRIVVKGEKEYRQAIRNASQAVKTLQSELKAETAELGKNATEQQKNELKAKSLKKQIQEQEKAVAAHRKALEEAREQYADNEQVIRKYELQLNQAREALANMHNQLDGLGEGMKDVGADAQMATVATKSLADSLGSIADVGSTISDAIEGIFSGMINTVKEAIATVWDDMMGLAYKANAWLDLAGFWNTDAETIQKWERAVSGSSNTFEDLQYAVTRINMGDQKKIAEATGVSGEAYEDKWQYAMAVMDALNAMDYEQKLEAAGDVFGEKRATKVLDILNEWGTIQEKLALFDVKNGGIGMTNEQMNDMATLAEQVDTIRATWRAFLDSFEAEHLGKLALDLTGNAQRILEDLIKYLDTGDDKDLEKLEKDIEEFFDRVKDAVLKAAEKLKEAGEKLEESDNGIVQAIGGALKGLANTLQWLSDKSNIDKVVAGFEALAGFWIAGKGAAFVAKIASLAANFKVISSFNAASAAAGATETASGLGGSIAAALAKVVLPVSLAAIACYPLIYKLIHGETEEERKNREMAEALAGEDGGLKSGAEVLTNPDRFRKIVNTLAGASGENEPEEEPAPSTDVYTSGVPSPANKRARFDATAEQQAAVNAFWDVWRGGNFTDEEFDAAWEELAAAFAGNEETLGQLDMWLEKLMAAYNQGSQWDDKFNEKDWMDIPSTWWQSPAGSGDNGITRGDLQAFNALPVSLQRAAKSGVAEGVSGLQVSMDGYAVGRIVAPYVSQMIAQEVV